MSNLRIKKTVNAPPEQVFARFADFAGAANHVESIDRVEMLTNGPIEPVGKGTRFKETRTIFGKQATEEMSVAEFEPDRKYTITADSCGTHYRKTFHFNPIPIHLNPQGSQTEVDMHFISQKFTLLARILSPIMSLLLGNSMKKMMQSDIDQVAAACEAMNN